MTYVVLRFGSSHQKINKADQPHQVSRFLGHANTSVDPHGGSSIPSALGLPYTHEFMFSESTAPQQRGRDG